ncbi:MAG: bacillithiol biosynthesis deacetylase BshB1 [Gemmatimonadetes bacterium]|nr:bacillithiol biosynthesis deacetylase BshB1 [Gemmatimonadota bacterium]
MMDRQPGDGVTVDLLAIMAHPDDAELLCGGTLARAADQGYRVGVLDLTGGEAGTWGSAEERTREAERAAAILGLSVRRNAGLPDGALVNSPEARAVVAAHLRRLRPRTVILHWKEGRHPDHRVASQLGYDACFVAGLRRAPIDGEPHRPSKVLYALAYREDVVKPSFVVDITAQIDRKLDAIFAFGTQFEGKTAMGEVFGGGDRPLREQLLAHAAHYGALIRRPYGEPFWTPETLRVDDVVSLDVRSI